ncbi:hypothetical protein BG000_010576 [Podila horticola]|nr:hypothetical protein BG000_010576 [Podila horticola]
MSQNNTPAPLSTQAPRCATILDLPTEILQTVFTYFSRGDLIKCSTVCKCWDTASKAFIWSAIGARFCSKFICDPTMGATVLSQYAHHVRQLEVRNESILEYLFVRKTVCLPNEWCPWSQFRLALYLNSTLLTNLHRLDIWCPLDSGTKSPSAKDMVSALIRNSSDLIALEIHCPQRLETTVRLINECKKLQELWVAFVMDMCSAKNLMDHAPESIRKVRLRVSKELGHHEFCAEANDILANEMMDIEGMLDEEIWEARVMSDPIIVIAHLVSPGEEEA